MAAKNVGESDAGALVDHLNDRLTDYGFVALASEDGLKVTGEASDEGGGGARVRLGGGPGYAGTSRGNRLFLDAATNKAKRPSPSAVLGAGRGAEGARTAALAVKAYAVNTPLVHAPACRPAVLAMLSMSARTDRTYTAHSHLILAKAL